MSGIDALGANVSGIDTPGGPSLPAPGSGGTGTLEREVETTPRPSHEDGDHERFAHYAPKDKILEAMVTGTPVRALCGKVWIPSRDPQKFPVCPTCKEIFESMPSGDDER